MVIMQINFNLMNIYDKYKQQNTAIHTRKKLPAWGSMIETEFSTENILSNNFYIKEVYFSLCFCPQIGETFFDSYSTQNNALQNYTLYSHNRKPCTYTYGIIVGTIHPSWYIISYLFFVITSYTMTTSTYI